MKIQGEPCHATALNIFNAVHKTKYYIYTQTDEKTCKNLNFYKNDIYSNKTMKCQFSLTKQNSTNRMQVREMKCRLSEAQTGVMYRVLKVSILFASVTPLSLIYSNTYKWMAGIYLQSILQ